MKNETKVEPLAVSVVEAATMIGVCPRTIQNYIALKLLHSRKVGRRRLVLVDALKQFLRCDQPTAEAARAESGQ
jgi:hypothetical protein